jgi:hypothetical protein
MAGLNPAIVFIVSISLVGLAGFLMWHLVESRFLASNSHYREVSIKA